MISASLDAWLRPNKTSQPNTRIMNKYSRRTDTNRDRASTRPSRQIAGHGHVSSSETVHACDFEAANPGQWMTHCHNLYYAPRAA